MATPFKSQSIIQSEDQKLKEPYMTIDKQNIDQNVENIKYLVNKLGYSLINVNRLDFYANSIPIGAFCNAVAFIIFGFTKLKIFKPDDDIKDNFLQGIVLIFGGLGQITAGFLEFMKARSYSAMLYLTLGFYSFSHFFITDESKITFGNEPSSEKKEKGLFFGAWFLIILPLVLASIKINLFFLAQTGCTCLFFLFRWIGEVSDEDRLTNYASGVFQSLAGLISLYILGNQIINSVMHKELLPLVPFDRENDIDISILQNIEIKPPQ